MKLLPPRTPNCTESVSAIIDSWREGQPVANPSLMGRLSTSKFGNLNLDGSYDCATAATIPPWHPAYPASIEAGVRPLCMYVNNHLGLITYTSCEGHDYRSIAREPSMRHVGIIPRNRQELSDTEALWRYAERVLPPDIEQLGIELGMMVHQLYDYNGSTEVIDLYICKHDTSGWDQYFAHIDTFTHSIVRVLTQVHDDNI